MAYLLYHKGFGTSGIKLAKYMGIPAYRGGKVPESLARPDHIIRWGSGAAVPLKPTLSTLNSRKGLGKYANRYDQLTLLGQGGVSVPKHEGCIPCTFGFPLIARDWPKHGQPTGGKGITFYGFGDVLPSHNMYMEYIKKDRQFRVHVIAGRVRVREVMPREGIDPTEETIWNLKKFIYRIPTEPVPTVVIPQAVAAVASLDLQFGAVDVITLNSKAWILEVNTAPGLSDPTLAWYAAQLGQFIAPIPAMPGQLENVV